ncbi:MAG: PIG-L deacetylase family protein [Vicinamibacterales bacterium]
MGPTLLCLFAHPDDETFLAAGSLARYAREGVRLGIVTATRGQSGRTGDPPVCSKEELGHVRERELRAAAQVIGLTDVTVLGYQDRQLAAAPVVGIRRDLVRAIRRLRPQVVLTFDPQGGNGHPDHVAISAFATDAVAAAADPRWFPEDGREWSVPRVLWPPPVPPWTLVSERADLSRTPGVDFVLDVTAWAGSKLEALRCHRTQNLSVNRVFLSHPDMTARLSVEMFRQASGPPLPSRPLDDLFAGVGV